MHVTVGDSMVDSTHDERRVQPRRDVVRRYLFKDGNDQQHWYLIHAEVSLRVNVKADSQSLPPLKLIATASSLSIFLIRYITLAQACEPTR